MAVREVQDNGAQVAVAHSHLLFMSQPSDGESAVIEDIDSFLEMT
jgi:hypothetical protein